MKQPGSITEIILLPGQLYFGDRNVRIRTILGSCVSITMWHPVLLIGGMCHYMLASSQCRDMGQLSGRYGEEAIQMLLKEAARHNTNPHDYIFKIFGGGNMFPKQKSQCIHSPLQHYNPEADRCRNVSCENSRIGRMLLKQHHLNVAAEHLGGTGHRNVVFDIWSGDTWVRQFPLAEQVSSQ